MTYIAVHEDGHSVPVTFEQHEPGHWTATWTPDVAGQWHLARADGQAVTAAHPIVDPGRSMWEEWYIT